MPFTTPRQLTQQLRSDVIAAWNLLVQAGKLDRDYHYAFRQRNGVWGIEMWKGSRFDPDGGVAWAQCEELIVAAGPLKQVRGYD